MSYAANAAGFFLSARFLGPSGRGAYSALLAWATVCASVSGLSLGIAIARALAVGGDTGALVRSLPARWAMCSTAGVVGLIGLQALFLAKTVGNEAAVILSAVVVPALVICDWGTYFFQGAGMLRHYALARLLPAALTLCFLLGGVLFGLTLPVAVASFVLANWLVGVWMFVSIRGHTLDRLERPINRQRVPLLRYGLRSHPGTLASIANARLDLLVLSLLVPLSVLGNYSLAVSITGPVAVIGSSVGAASFRAIGTTSAPQELLRGVWTRFSKPTVTLALFACIIAGFVPRLVGSAYNQAVIPILVLAVGSIGLGAIYLGVSLLQARGAAGKSSLLFVVAAVISAITLLVLVPPLGIIGASLSTSITYLSVGTASFLITVNGVGAKSRPAANPI